MFIGAVLSNGDKLGASANDRGDRARRISIGGRGQGGRIRDARERRKHQRYPWHSLIYNAVTGGEINIITIIIITVIIIIIMSVRRRN